MACCGHEIAQVPPHEGCRSPPPPPDIPGLCRPQDGDRLAVAEDDEGVPMGDPCQTLASLSPKGSGRDRQFHASDGTAAPAENQAV